MMIQDGRIPLAISSKPALRHSTYTIIDVVGCGGSGLAYSAELMSEECEQEIGAVNTPAIVKEFYPAELAQGIIRDDNGALLIEADAQDTFYTLKSRFESGTAALKTFCVSDSNHTLPSPAIDAANGTVYSASAIARGNTLSDCRDSLTMREKADVFTSLCNAVSKLHVSGRLHLDLKPSNIFVFEKDNNESRRIALFDFDTVIPLNDVLSTSISYSEGWSPYEQVNGRREEITYATDVYALGMVCYWLYSGEKATDMVLNDIVRGRFGFLNEINELRGVKGPSKVLADILFASLKRVPGRRAQRVEELPL
jgi:serine/threonine protein kinase